MSKNLRHHTIYFYLNLVFQNFVMDHIIRKLKHEISVRLPGKEAQYKMAPEGRITSFSNTNAVNGSVLILLFPLKDLHLVLIRRSDYAGLHSGQVSFPGGKSEPGDPDLVHTALRESYEEVGIKKENIEIIGNLTPLYIPPSNFNVLPVIGYSKKEPIFHINHREVK